MGYPVFASAAESQQTFWLEFKNSGAGMYASGTFADALRAARKMNSGNRPGTVVVLWDGRRRAAEVGGPRDWISEAYFGLDGGCGQDCQAHSARDDFNGAPVSP